MSLEGDHVYMHGSEVFCVKSCSAQDGLDLIATPTSCNILASFHIGTTASALAWSPRTSSPLTGSKFHIELVAACSNRELRHLYKSQDSGESITIVASDNIIGHTSQIRDLNFCDAPSGGSGGKYLVSVADDKRLVIWDIFPECRVNDIATPRDTSVDSVLNSLIPPGYAETWTCSFTNPLLSVDTHPEMSKTLLVADSRGSVHLVDWEACRSLGRTRGEQVLMEFIEPHSLSQLVFSPKHSYTGSVSWKRDDSNTLAATFGDRWAIWEQTRGSKPHLAGSTFSRGAHRIRWCPTDSSLFALSPLSQSYGSVLHIHNVGFINSPPTRLEIVSKPHYIRDFDWLGVTYKDSPLVAVAVGKLVHILRIGESPDEVN